MASAYALPLDSGRHVHGHHAHGHSHSHHSLRPERSSSSWLGQINEAAVKRTSSSGNLDSQALSDGHSHPASAAPSAGGFDTPPRPTSETMQSYPVKSRLRGESDQGRPSPRTQSADSGYGFSSVPERDTSTVEPWLTAREAITALLIPLPYLFASLAYPSASTTVAPSSPYDRLKDTVPGDKESVASHSHPDLVGVSALLQTCCLASGTLLLTGLIGGLNPSDRVLDRRKRDLVSGDLQGTKNGDLFKNNAIRRIVARVLSVGLPFYAAMQLGGVRTSFVLLTTFGSGLSGLNISPLHQNVAQAWLKTASIRKFTCAVLLLSFLFDLFGLAKSIGTRSFFLGHLSLALTVFLFPPPLAVTGASPISAPYSSSSSISGLETPYDAPKVAARASFPAPVSPLVSSMEDIKLTLISGFILSVFTIFYAVVTSTFPSLSYTSIVFTALSLSSTLGLIFLSLPSSLRSTRKVGVAVGYVATICFGYFLHSDGWQGFVALGVLSSLSYFAVSYDTALPVQSSGHSHHQHSHNHHDHHYDHKYQPPELAHLHDHSKASGILIALCTPGSIIHSILIEKDSRRIAYFACLNLGFMLVQFFYGFVSGSLGLLTDSIHMLFDCLALAVGLAAAVMTKRPPNAQFPYGYGKIDTLSGFANGIFLMLVSVEIVFDAFEKLYEGHEMRRLNELLVVSILGLLVNIVGLTAFGHAHHGHGHDHGHSHGDHDHGHGHGHSHHDNENMHGIFLHILADTLGSAAVIVSTILAKWTGWAGWDPIASTIIAVLIAVSAYPLVKSSGMRLLLSMPADVEYRIRNTLQEISSLRGVVGYVVPKFWLEDAGAAHADAHAHEHDHSHEHSHKHTASGHEGACQGHEHSHGDDHCHDNDHHDHHSHSHSHDHDHDHNHAHSHSHEGHNHGHSNSHHSHHDHSHSHDHSHEAPQKKVLGVIHIIASRVADMEDVRERTSQFLRGRGMDVLVHVEREGEGWCWCGGGTKKVGG